MTRSHVIGHTLIEVKFESEEEAFAHQAVLTSSVKNRLLPVMDDVFTELSPADHILRIDRLEVDLGVIAADGFAEEMARRLKERLGDALREHLQRIGPLHTAELISPSLEEFECVKHFLQTGSLPWQATPGLGWSIDDLLQRVIASHGLQLLTFLRGAIGRGNVLTRLVYQFSESVLIDLVRLLEPGAEEFIVEAISCLDLDRSRPGWSPDGSSRRRGWEFTLAYLLVEQGHRFDQRAYLASMIRQEATHTRGATPDLLEALMRERDGGADSPASSRAVRAVLDELAATWGPHPPAPAEGEARSAALLRAYDRAETLRSWLLTGVEPEGGEPLSVLLDSLVRDSPWLLLQLAGDLQTGDMEGVSDAGRVPSDVWRSFWATLLARWPGIDRAAWQRVLDRAGEPRRNDLRLYGTLLEQLLRGQAVTEELRHDEPTTELQAGARPESRPVSREPARPSTAAERSGLGAHLSEAECLAIVQSSDPLSEEDGIRMIATLDHVSAATADRLRRPITALLADRATVDRLIERWSERLLTRLLYLVRPAEHAEAQRVVGLLSLAGLGVGGLDPTGLRRAAWQVLFRDLIEVGRPVVLDTVVPRFIALLTEQGSQPDTGLVRARLRLNLMHRIVPASPIDFRTVIALSRTDENDLVGRASGRRDLTRGREEEPDDTEQVYITNAGQVLASAYLPRLFAMLNLTEQNAFRDSTSAMRAVHLLQFMVNQSVDSPEYQLVLNKILCGVKPGVPIERRIVITTDERQAIEGMLRSMIQHWKVVGNTSIAGLRESFLQREGRLRLQGEAWHLLVEPRAFDMLLDQIPWSFSTIKYPWMDRVLYVEWR